MIDDRDSNSTNIKSRSDDERSDDESIWYIVIVCMTVTVLLILTLFIIIYIQKRNANTRIVWKKMEISTIMGFLRQSSGSQTKSSHTQSNNSENQIKHLTLPDSSASSSEDRQRFVVPFMKSSAPSKTDSKKSKSSDSLDIHNF